MAVNVFTGWTYLIPEHRSDMLSTKIRPHMSETEGPGASEMPLVPCLPVPVGTLGAVGFGVNLEAM